MYFEPVSGELAVTRVEAFVGELPFSRRDAYDRDTFLIASNDDTLQRAIAAREADQRKFPMTVTLISIHAHRIDVAYRIEPLESVRRFVVWLRDQYEVRIRDEDFNDVTANVDPGLVYLFGSP